ncbi:MAG: hypothetical protein LC659_04425, partial [Myxococcales bacterium]|nr:hypothetical protein [Myxococcales bacterium]
PTPQTMALAATADASPAVRVRVAFADVAAAQAFARAWPGVRQRYREATALLGLAQALDGFTLDINDAQVELTGRVPEPQMRLALNWVRALLPAPHPAALDAGAPPK